MPLWTFNLSVGGYNFGVVAMLPLLWRHGLNAHLVSTVERGLEGEIA